MPLFTRFFLICTILFSLSTSCEAAFIRRVPVAATAASAIATGTSTAIGEEKEKKKEKTYYHHNRETREAHKRKPSESGWEGIVAFVCGVVGIPILSIVFGAMGMGKGHKNRGFAIAGFVLGILQILAIGLMILVFALMWG